MKNVNRKKQLFFDFGRDYEANLDNFFFSSKNKPLQSELENFLNGAESQNVFLTADSGNGKTFLLNSILNHELLQNLQLIYICLLYTSPSPRDRTRSRMPSSA